MTRYASPDRHVIPSTPAFAVRGSRVPGRWHYTGIHKAHVCSTQAFAPEEIELISPPLPNLLMWRLCPGQAHVPLLLSWYSGVLALYRTDSGVKYNGKSVCRVYDRCETCSVEFFLSQNYKTRADFVP